MPKVVATAKGFHGGLIREVGHKFDWPEGQKLASWVRQVGQGNAEAVSAAPVSPPGTVLSEAVTPIPLDWRSLGAGKRKDMAEKISGARPANVSEADAVIEAEIERRKPEAFADAPAASVVEGGNGVQAALGGPEPDWLPPGAQSTEEI